MSSFVFTNVSISKCYVYNEDDAMFLKDESVYFNSKRIKSVSRDNVEIPEAFDIEMLFRTALGGGTSLIAIGNRIV